MIRALLLGLVLVLGVACDIDRCLDRGGRWNYDTEECEFDTSESRKDAE